ncbi:hypothetical protein [Fodinicola feengrottensis]|uniref:hypothetical protein n=1 Tax=Fodinicola feengrottensis TaxID=435914 RepID=UPI0031E1A17E
MVALDQSRAGSVLGCPSAALLRRLGLLIGLAVGGWIALALLTSVAAHAASTDPGNARTDVLTASSRAATGADPAAAPITGLSQTLNAPATTDTAPATDVVSQASAPVAGTIERPLTAVAATVGSVVEPIGSAVRLVTDALPALGLGSSRLVAAVHVTARTSGFAQTVATTVPRHPAGLPAIIKLVRPHSVGTAPIALPRHPVPAGTAGLPDLASAPAGTAHVAGGSAAAAIPAARVTVPAPTGLAATRPAGSWRVRNTALDPSVSPD